MKTLAILGMLGAGCGGAVDTVAETDIVHVDAGTYANCRPMNEPEAGLAPTLVWVAPGPKSDWAPCEAETAQGAALWCCP